MPAAGKIAPVRKSIRVAVPRGRAFEVFTTGMHRWWPLEHSILKAPRAAITAEPRVGGRWFERAIDGTECTLGRVLAWDPPERVVLTWQLNADFAYDPDFVTEVEIRFTSEGDNATRVDLEHRNLERYGERAETIRPMLDSPQGWGLCLAGFAAVVEGVSSSAAS